MMGVEVMYPVEGIKRTPVEDSRSLLAAMPKSIRIGAHDFELRVISASESEQRKIYGQFMPLVMRIDIAETHPATTMLAMTVIHEMLHGLWRAAHLSDDQKLEEDTVACLADGLVALFRDNPWLTGWIAEAVK